jgi:hypothetical protein
VSDGDIDIDRDFDCDVDRDIDIDIGRYFDSGSANAQSTNA